MGSSGITIKQELDLTNLSISPINIDEEKDLHVSWAEEAPEYLDTSVASATEVHCDTDIKPIKTEYEDTETEMKLQPTSATAATSKRRVIPFDYENFCSDIPENELPIFKGCAMKLNPRPSSNSTGHFLTVPKANYGRKRRSVSSKIAIKSEASFHSYSPVVIKREPDSNSNYEYMKEEVDDDDFLVKQPMRLQPKKIIPPPSPEMESFCTIM